MPEATIRDVARQARVSVASVSRVLNGAVNVSEPMRLRIEEAVRSLGYVPHAGARSLSMKRTNALGVVLPDLHGEFFSEIVRGMDREASAHDYLLLLSPLHGGHEKPAKALSAMRGRVDGLLLMAPHIEESALAAALPPGLPVILMNTRSAAGSGTIQLDNETGAKEVAEHLLAIGRTRIVHITGPQSNIDAQERAAAFIAEVERAGLKVKLVPGDFSESSGEAGIRMLLDSGEPFDAVFAANDMMAIGALTALRRAGIAIPGTVAVAGFDDIPLARHLGLTTVQVHIAELGRAAVAMQLAALDRRNPEPSTNQHRPELVVRATTPSEREKAC
jgi:LacI family transcriptional regulator